MCLRVTQFQAITNLTQPGASTDQMCMCYASPQPTACIKEFTIIPLLANSRTWNIKVQLKVLPLGFGIA